jgi:hypothetical protein
MSSAMIAGVSTVTDRSVRIQWKFTMERRYDCERLISWMLKLVDLGEREKLK